MRRVLALALVLLGACGGDGRLAFREDDRVEIVQPDQDQEVSLPVRLRWRADGAGPYYAVFVDREPIPPGHSLRVLADETCERDPDCPDAEYLRDRNIYVTDETALELKTVPSRGGRQRTGADDRHEAVIVLIDEDGRRQGEAAYRVSFEVKAS